MRVMLSATLADEVPEPVVRNHMTIHVSTAEIAADAAISCRVSAVRTTAAHRGFTGSGTAASRFLVAGRSRRPKMSDIDSNAAATGASPHSIYVHSGPRFLRLHSALADTDAFRV